MRHTVAEKCEKRWLYMFCYNCSFEYISNYVTRCPNCNCGNISTLPIDMVITENGENVRL